MPDPAPDPIDTAARAAAEELRRDREGLDSAACLGAEQAADADAEWVRLAEPVIARHVRGAVGPVLAEAGRLRAEVARLREASLRLGLERAVEIIEADGKPGPGGIDITNGIPSVIYVGIGRDRYDTEYEVAEDTAAAVRADLVQAIRHELGSVPQAPAAPAGGE